MSIITFKSNELKETGQTLSLVAVATQMAIEHNFKILIVSTSFDDRTLENCYWEVEKTNRLNFNSSMQIGISVDSSVEGLIKVIAANKTNPEIIKNYARTVLRDRLDVLMSPRTKSYDEYVQISSIYPEILQVADRYYDFIFVDLDSKMRKQEAMNIMNISDIVIANITQRLSNINNFIESKEQEEIYNRKNVMLLLGRYDSYSKYSVKNVSRYMKERRPILAIPYNTLYFEACSEGKVIDFFLKLRNVDGNDRNYLFVNQINKVVESIIYKLQELQMKI